MTNLATLMPLDSPPRWLDSTTWPVVPNASSLLTDMLNIAWFLALLHRLPRLWSSGSDQTFGRAILAVFVFVGTIVSSQNYTVHLAAVLVPLTLAVLGDDRNPVEEARILCVVTSIWVLFSIVSMPTSFHKLVAFRGPPAFAGVRAPAEYVSLVKESFDNVTPLIRDQTIAWVFMYGPHAAYGGIPATPNVVS